MESVWLGEVVYEDALALQRLLVERRVSDQTDDVVLTLTHDRVYTAGRHADLARNLLGTRPDIRVVEIDRGGDLTYHGPGQLVAYPIVKLRHSKEVRAFVEGLVAACVRTARSFGVAARGDARHTGVWVAGFGKLAAVGIRIDRRVTSLGLAFNVAPRLEDFGGIVPCGIADAGVCSLASLGVEATVDEVRDRLVAHLAETLDRPLTPVAAVETGS